MRERLDACIQFKDARSIASVEEKGKCFQLNNVNKKATISCVKIDGCVFKNEDTIRCDYLFEVDDPSRKRIFYIELKGTDLIKGIKQISKTLELTINVFEGSVYEARIVMGSVPLVSNRREYLDLLDIVKRSGGTILIRNQKICKELL
jgi:hypothetical protein